ncbi:MAG: ribosomal subunit interface protein [Alphaproteobacteria bacterium]|nr:MAG: ribosomal subunit interface protein [Alphaproteobacteria bacterium]
MKVTIHGHHLDLGDALKTHIEEKLNTINDKYFNRAVHVTVTMSKDSKSHFKAHVAMTMGKDIHVQASADDYEAYTTFDQAAEKIAKQLRRYKRKIREHGEARENAEAIKALDYTLGYSVTDDQLSELSDEEIEDQDEAIVVAEMTTNIQTMTVSDAAMRLNLSGNNALMFRNASDDSLNMVYRRGDGNIGWVDPKENAATTTKVA